MKRRNNLDDLDIEGRIMLTCIFKEQDVRVMTGFNSLCMESSGEFL
jgi:hypothetical protein